MRDDLPSGVTPHLALKRRSQNIARHWHVCRMVLWHCRTALPAELTGVCVLQYDKNRSQALEFEELRSVLGDLGMLVRDSCPPPISLRSIARPWGNGTLHSTNLSHIAAHLTALGVLCVGQLQLLAACCLPGHPAWMVHRRAVCRA